MTVAYLAKGLVDLTFWGAFAWYLVKYLVSIAVALGGIMLGIKLRKMKNESQAAKAEAVEASAES